MKIRGLSVGQFGTLLRQRPWQPGTTTRVFLAVCDHYEPMWGRPSRAIQDERVARWVQGYPRSVAGIEDSTGRCPQHTFFYPADEYDAEHVDKIAELCREGYGELEVHLHHRHDTSQSLRDRLENYVDCLFRRHGMLHLDQSGKVTYGFIHGNWALDNSRPDGDWCGVNDELTILRETGCYADFTLPSAPDPCQTETINSIYYAIDDPASPKSHDHGIRAQAGRPGPRDGLLMIQGPLGVDWNRRKWGVFPKLENGDLTGSHPPTLSRFKIWCRANVAVQGHEETVFVKLHTHGAQESNGKMLLGEPMIRFHQELAKYARRDQGFSYFYVTAYEMAQLVHQMELERLDCLISVAGM